MGEASGVVTLTPRTCIDGRMTENMSAQHDTVEHTSENGRSSIFFIAACVCVFAGSLKSKESCIKR